VFIDIGSTTTDLVRFGDGRVQNQGYTDGERLRSKELVYTGAIRTNAIMARWRTGSRSPGNGSA
jgi:uncharacterized hydantoinase/oxoprolinase family protein